LQVTGQSQLCCFVAHASVQMIELVSFVGPLGVNGADTEVV